jgi:hypothetical protein
MTTAGQRILQALGAGQIHARPLPAVFGTIGGQQTVAELKDLVNLWTERVNSLQTAFSAFSAKWMAADPNGFNAWMNDWVHLLSRRDAAMVTVNEQIKAASSNPLPDSAIVAQAGYDALSKAMRQCYPPDGCPVQTGDWDDLFSRLTDATNQYGGTAPVDNPPQPTATDIDQGVLATTAPLDVIAQITGGLAPTLPGTGILAWMLDHKTIILIGVTIIGGFVAFKVVTGLLPHAAKAAPLFLL